MAVNSSALGLAVTGIGMVSPLGLDAATSCASARAGLSRAAPIEAFTLYSEEQWASVGVIGHAARLYTRGFEGFGKLVRLAAGALADLLSSAPLQPAEWERTAFCLVVSSRYFETEAAGLAEATLEDAVAARQFSETVSTSLMSRVCDLNKLADIPENRFLFAEDQTGFCHALIEAQQLIADGRFDRCLLGGVDALTEATTMAAAHRFHALKTEQQPAGFQPGEAAAFVLLESVASAESRGLPVLGRVDAAAAGVDSVGRCMAEPALGLGLAETIAACLAVLAERECDFTWMLGDLNGDAFRANDWGYAVVRLMPAHPTIGDCAMTLPAESFGELGAAAGPVALCMAVRAFARDYAPSPAVLGWLSSYRGGRGAYVVRAGA